MLFLIKEKQYKHFNEKDNKWFAETAHLDVSVISNITEKRCKIFSMGRILRGKTFAPQYTRMRTAA